MITVTIGLDAFDVGIETKRLGVHGVGAVASFVGVVRNDGNLTALTLEHYPGMTEAALATLAHVASDRWSLLAATIYHRVGQLVPGDPIVFVGTSAPHRRDALEACAFLIDRLKTDAPLWKRESFGDGREAWVEARAADQAATTASRCKAQFRQLSRLPRSSFASQDHHLISFDQLDDVVRLGGDRQRLVQAELGYAGIANRDCRY